MCVTVTIVAAMKPIAANAHDTYQKCNKIAQVNAAADSEIINADTFCYWRLQWIWVAATHMHLLRLQCVELLLSANCKIIRA
jgi:hypothetical protein